MTRRLGNPAALQAHADKGLGCELKPFLHCCQLFGPTVIHHPLAGHGNRIDAAWNLVSVCERGHQWCHENKTAGLVLCWDRIAERGDMDWEALATFWRQNPRARIEMVADDAGSRWQLIARSMLKRWFND